MKTFLQWVEEEKKDLPVISNDSDDDKKPSLQEKTKRGGIGNQYPDAYVRQQYPRKYFNPIAADADYKLSAAPHKGGADTAN